MTFRLASCSCGQLRTEVLGELIGVSVCHCYACQRRTGSVFGAQARHVSAPADLFSDGSNSANESPNCGCQARMTTKILMGERVDDVRQVVSTFYAVWWKGRRSL
jgi:hypothetical protein